MKLRTPQLNFASLSTRPVTDMIVLHHTGGNDIDASAEQIHGWHVAQGWAGCGYHFVIRKDGTVEIGRPEWATGSHAYGENNHTLGIHLSGDFEQATPTAAQIQACAELVADLCRDYKIPLDRKHIVGHRDLMATDCPGKNLYARIRDIIAAAAVTPVTNDTPQGTPIKNIYDLARRYESAEDCAAVGCGYGLYQFTPKVVKTFVAWLKNYPDDKLANYGWHLDGAKNFDGEWQMLGTVDPGHFAQLQDEFVKANYLDEAAKLLAKENFNVGKHTFQMHAVVLARAIQHGVFGCVELFKRACPHPNLSYVDDPKFDRELIAAVYDYLIEHPTFGIANVKLSAALRERFIKEKVDALA